MKTMVWILAVLGAATAAGFVFAAAVATYLYVHDGTLEVQVRPRSGGGDEVSILCPAVLARVALACVPVHELEVDADATEILPVAEQAIARLERCPDARFVEATSGDEHVVISKKGARLVVEVDTREQSVRVALPFAAAKSALRELSRRVISGRRPAPESGPSEVRPAAPAAAATPAALRTPAPSPARP